MDILIFLYLAIFPFGKLLGNLTDLIVLIICIFAFIKRRGLKVDNFLWMALFSLFFSLSFFKLPEIITGISYFVRLASYFYLSRIVMLRFDKQKKKRELIFNSLIIIGVFIAIFGWIQYLFIPDLRALKILEWDDHYFRLVSTFFDPAFTGILLVLTEILVLVKTLFRKDNFLYLINIFLIMTILFTYSRASYLAMFFALIFLFLKFRKKLILFLMPLFLIIFILPRPGGEGVNLARTYSINDRFINYRESLNIISKSPLFGVGFNNICIVKRGNLMSHSCGGLDNSVLFIIATTGVVGLMIFLNSIFHIINKTRKDYIGVSLIVNLLAIFIHGMFSETFFYPFILGWIAILIGISRVISDF